MRKLILTAAAAFVFMQAGFAGNDASSQDASALNDIRDELSELNEEGEYELVIETADKALREYPGDYAIYYELAYALTETEDYKAALAAADKCRKLNPDYSWGHFQYALILQDIGRYREAVKAADKAIEREKLWVFYSRRAELKFDLKDYRGAIKDYDACLKISDDDSDACVYRGDAYDYLGESEKALESYDMAVKIDPKNSFAYNHRGTTKRNRGDIKGAIEDLTKAIQFDPEDVDSYESRGILRGRNGDYSGAMEDFNKSISINPKRGEGYYWRADAKEAHGEAEAARADYLKAFELEPKNEIFRSHAYPVGEKIIDKEVKRQMARTKKIMGYSERISANRKDINAYLFRGCQYLGAGNTEKAGEDFKMVWKLFIHQVK